MICGTSVPPAPDEMAAGGRTERGGWSGVLGERGNVTFTLRFTSRPVMIIFPHFHSKFVSGEG